MQQVDLIERDARHVCEQMPSDGALRWCLAATEKTIERLWGGD